MSPVRPVLCAAMVACVAAALPAAASAAPSLSLSVDPAVPGRDQRFSVVARGVRESPPNEAGPGSSRLSVFLNLAREPCAPTDELEGAKSETSNGGGVTHIPGLEAPDGPFELRRKFGLLGTTNVPWVGRFGLKTGRYRFCGYLTNDEAYPTPPPLVLTRLDFTVRKNCANARADAANAAIELKNEKKTLKYTLKRTGRRYHKRARSRVKKAKRALKRARRVRKALC